MKRCINCHRPLKGKLSIQRGMGRSCFRKIVGKAPRRKRHETLSGQEWEQVGLFEELNDAGI